MKVGKRTDRPIARTVGRLTALCVSVAVAAGPATAFTATVSPVPVSSHGDARGLIPTAGSTGTTSSAPSTSSPVASPTLAPRPMPRPAVKKKVKIRWRTCRASWYGPGFYGHTMAGGGNLRPSSMIVAHRTLPFGTVIQVRWHGKRVIAVVNDRGPYVRGREMDLGPGVRWKLGFAGAQKIQYRIIKMGKRRR